MFCMFSQQFPSQMAHSDMPPAHLRPQAGTGEDYNVLEVTSKEVNNEFLSYLQHCN